MMLLMALSPQQRKEAHERGLRAKAEREARKERNKPIAAVYGAEYERFRQVGLNHEKALEKVEERKMAEERFKKERGDIGLLGGGTRVGPKGGRYRINSNGRKSYDVQ